MKPITLAAALLLLTISIGGVTNGAHAESDALLDRAVCEPPISVCRLPFEAKLSTDLRPDILPPVCPDGFRCECVPSCPTCKDCAARVCIPGKPLECRTACDCEPGLGCFNGQCIAGVASDPDFAPVFCCDDDRCPPGQLCQDRHGNFDRCFDPMCSERVTKVTRTIRAWVHRWNRCEVDSDCVAVNTSTECIGACDSYVNKKFAGRLVRAIDKIDERVCDTFQEDGCPFVTPACLLQRPACQHNRCVGVPRLPGPPRPRPISDANQIADENRFVNIEPQP